MHQSTESPCQLFEGRTDQDGYGVVSVNRNGKWVPARVHRIAWAIHNGADPEGMMVLHSCDNRRCVNPEHLRTGTHRDNMDDMVNRKRKIGFRCPHTKVTRGIVLKIRELYSSGLTTKKISQLVGLCNDTVWRVASGRSWSEVV